MAAREIHRGADGDEHDTNSIVSKRGTAQNGDVDEPTEKGWTEPELGDRNSSLWDHPVGWDVLVVCRNHSWCVHSHILAQCPYLIAGKLPLLPATWNSQDADDPKQARTRDLWAVVLHEHDPGQLSNVLRFLYSHDEPLYADSLLTNTAMFIAAASVACFPMMEYAGSLISHYVNTLYWHLTPDRVQDSPRIDYAILRLATPLRVSLTILYEQPGASLGRYEGQADQGDYYYYGWGHHEYGNVWDTSPAAAAYRSQGILWCLRRMLVCLVIDVLPLLALNPAFHAQFRNEWHRASFVQKLQQDMEQERMLEWDQRAALLIHTANKASRPPAEEEGASKSTSSKRSQKRKACEAEWADAGLSTSPIQKALAVLSLLHQLADAEESWVAAILNHQSQSTPVFDEDEDDSSRSLPSATTDEGEEAFFPEPEEKRVAEVIGQLDSLGLKEVQETFVSLGDGWE